MRRALGHPRHLVMRDLSRKPRSPRHQHGRRVKRPWSFEQVVEGWRGGARKSPAIRAVARYLASIRRIEGQRQLIPANTAWTVTGPVPRRHVSGPPTGRSNDGAKFDDNRRAVDEAATIGARCLVLIAGGLPKGSKDIDKRAGARCATGMGGAACPMRGKPASRLAIEPMHPMYAADRGLPQPPCARDETTCVRQLGDGRRYRRSTPIMSGGTPSSSARSARAAGKRIVSYHVCDWLVAHHRPAARPRA